MKKIGTLCAVLGLGLTVVSLIFRVKDGYLDFSTRGIMEFTQTLLLLGICFGVSSSSE